MMKYSALTALLVLAAAISGFCQEDTTHKNAQMQIDQYWFVMLTKGANRIQDSVKAAEIQKGHLANITRLYNEGKLKVAGPFGDNGDWLGIFIFDAKAAGCASKEEVEKLLKTDPAIAAGRLKYEIHAWWTSPDANFKHGKP